MLSLRNHSAWPSETKEAQNELYVMHRCVWYLFSCMELYTFSDLIMCTFSKKIRRDSYIWTASTIWVVNYCDQGSSTRLPGVRFVPIRSWTIERLVQQFFFCYFVTLFHTRIMLATMMSTCREHSTSFYAMHTALKLLAGDIIQTINHKAENELSVGS